MTRRGRSLTARRCARSGARGRGRRAGRGGRHARGDGGKEGRRERGRERGREAGSGTGHRHRCPRTAPGKLPPSPAPWSLPSRAKPLPLSGTKIPACSPACPAAFLPSAPASPARRRPRPLPRPAGTAFPSLRGHLPGPAPGAQGAPYPRAPSAAGCGPSGNTCRSFCFIGVLAAGGCRTNIQQLFLGCGTEGLPVFCGWLPPPPPLFFNSLHHLIFKIKSAKSITIQYLLKKILSS